MSKVFAKVYRLTKMIPKGKVTTYGVIAQKLGLNPRIVGWALHKNPTPVVIPCHRVVAANGGLHGFAQGLAKKKELLEKEGVKVRNNKVDLKKYLWKSTSVERTDREMIE